MPYVRTCGRHVMLLASARSFDATIQWDKFTRPSNWHAVVNFLGFSVDAQDLHEYYFRTLNLVACFWITKVTSPIYRYYTKFTVWLHALRYFCELEIMTYIIRDTYTLRRKRIYYNSEMSWSWLILKHCVNPSLDGLVVPFLFLGFREHQASCFAIDYFTNFQP